MKGCITKLTGREAIDLLYAEHLITLDSMARDAMVRTLNNSDPAWIGDIDSKIIAVWGLIAPTLLSDRAYLWLYTTKHFDGHQFMFVRHSQRVIQDCLALYPTIVGHCMIDNPRAQRWLRWLGAEFGPPVDGGAIPFEIKAPQWPPQSAQSA